MRHSAATKAKNRIFPRGAILIYPVLVVLVLFLIFPDKSSFSRLFSASRSDAVSISYLEQLLRTAPDDWQLRMELVRQLQQTGQYQKARRVLGPIKLSSLDNEQTGLYRLVWAEVLAQLGFASNDPVKRAFWLQQARGWLKENRWQVSNKEMMIRQARLALSLELPALAAEFYRRLAYLESQYQHHWLGQSAKAYLAAGKGREAGRTYKLMAFIASTPEQKQQNLINSAKAFLSQEDYVDAYQAIHLVITPDTSSADIVLMGVRSALQINADHSVRQWLEQLLKLPLGMIQLIEVQQLALGSGRVDLAVIAAEHRLKLAPDNGAIREQLALFYQWQNKPMLALEQYRWLSLHQSTPGMTLKAAKLADALFDYEIAAEVLEVASNRRSLQRSEIDLLLESWESLGEPEEAEAFLRSYLKQHHDDLQAWLRLTQLLEDQQKLEQLVSTWEEMHRYVDLSGTEVIRYYQLMHQLGRGAEALDILHEVASEHDSHSGNVEHDHEELWQLIGDIAWQHEDDYAVVDSLRHLMGHGPLNELNIDRVLALPQAFSQKLRLQLALKEWQRYDRLNYGYIALELAVALERWSDAQRMLIRLSREPESRTNVIFWLAKAQLDQHDENYIEAVTAFDRAVRLSGYDAGVVEGYLWLLIASGQHNLLAQQLQYFSSRFNEEPQLWPVVAVSYSALQEYSQAMIWFDRAVKNQPDNYLLQLAYADTLVLAGRGAAALQIRQQVLLALNNKKGMPKKGLWWPRQIQFRTWLVGLAGSTTWVRQQGSENNRSSELSTNLWLPDFTALLIASGNLHGAAEWISRYHQQGGKAPLYQLLALAIPGDREALQPLLPRLDPSHPNRPEVLAMLGWEGHGLATALNQLDGNKIGPYHTDTLRQTVELNTPLPSGWRIAWHSKSDGSLGVNGPAFTYAQRFNRLHVQFDTAQLQTGDESDLLVKEPAAELNSRVQLTWPMSDGYWKTEIEQSALSGGNRYGVGAKRQWEWDSQLGSGLYFGYQQTPDVTSLMKVFGAEDKLGADLTYSVSPRNQIYLAAGIHRFSDRFDGEAIGKGYQLEAIWRHQLFFHRPEWQLVTGIDWQQYQLEDQLGAELNSYLVNKNDVSQLLPERYRYYYVGSRWSHGEPGALNARATSPRWVFGVNAGIQQPESTFSYGFEGGMGWRLFGNDELTLLLGYNSRPIGSTGDAGYQLQLSYQYRFGR